MDTETENEFRQALATRDTSYDGRFYYGVVSTGVYCRPSCASRAPRRENVRFFTACDAAEAAGFRPCKRCKPRAQTAHGALESRLQALARHIDAHHDTALPLASLAQRVGLSAQYLQRRFKAHFGVSPKAYQDAARLRALKTALRAGQGVLDATFAAGFGSTSRVYEQVDGRLGMTPSAYRAQGKGEEIVYAVRETGFGWLLMAATARGVCFVHFGDSASALEDRLRTEYPQATLSRSDAEHGPELDSWMAALAEHLDHAGPRPALPLDLRGTAFQIRVWQFLMSIGDGAVVSYTELARAIDAPRAVRAAASACAANNLAVLVPCHRVLRGDGSLGGYRWGLPRKRALIDQERARRTTNS